MNRFRTVFAIAAILAGGAAIPALASPVVLNQATHAFSLQGDTNCYQMAVAYHPTTQKYYGAGGGYSGCDGVVWGADGTKLQSLSPIGVDVRGVSYNANTGAIEVVSYGAASAYFDGYGVFSMGLDANGLYTGQNTRVLASAPGLGSDQVVAAYDSARNVLYSQEYGGAVNVVDRATGDLVKSIQLADQGATVNYEAIGYDPLNDVLVEYAVSTNEALVYALDGTLVGRSSLGGGRYDANYAMSYANGFLFVGNGWNGGYEAFQIMEAPADVPEPASLALLGLGVCGMVAARRKQGRSNA